MLVYKTKIVVIGAGQAGLSSAYHLHKLGLLPHKDYVVLDQEVRAGGAWQHRWPSLTLSTVNRVHDLPGLSFEDTLLQEGIGESVQARTAVPHYYEIYEKAFDLPVLRPLKVSVVCERDGRFRVETDRGIFAAEGLINATGTWDKPYIPEYPGAALFNGEQLHTRDYKHADQFKGKHVLIVGAGISAIQLLDEISQVTRTTWVSRRAPEFVEGPFDADRGREAVSMVEERVRQGLPPSSVVSVTGLPITPNIRAMKDRGVLENHPMFEEITPSGVRFPDGENLTVDTILWCTGFRSSLDHLAPLLIRDPQTGGILMDGRLATRLAQDHRIHLVGYGPSASTIGANRAGRAAARELLNHLSKDR